MAQSSWAQQAADRFFSSRKPPSQIQCDDTARKISGASAVRPVDSPGSTSYTIDGGMVKLAREIHGDLVPVSTCHGSVEEADPPLFIYSMPYLRGSYFARCWSSPQPVDPQTQSEKQEGTRKRLVLLLEESPPSRTLSESTLSKLIEALPSLFSQHYPQALTHGDFSVTNILVDKGTLEITGVVDWSLASVMPFGMDLDILYLATGIMTRDGWKDYTAQPQLREAFWNEFWAVSGIEGEERRARTRRLAEAAGQIGAILRLAFRRNDDGSPSDVVVPASEFGRQQLEAWLGK
ncbi:hypothetical protein F5Y17DRAFT_467094 [Xylariaceae sp. FL0594]|nr:hypothetical protein F5Y17DRAFT_467094 [Xylariaceae sp. FL0594]